LNAFAIASNWRTHVAENDGDRGGCGFGCKFSGVVADSSDDGHPSPGEPPVQESLDLTITPAVFDRLLLRPWRKAATSRATDSGDALW
jgi:hypothetical protein